MLLRKFAAMSELTFTLIEESARAVFKLSRDEYALCNYIQVWSAYPKNKRSGWCDRTKSQMASFVGISGRGLMKMLDRLESAGLIERLSQTLFAHRVTVKWFEVVTLAKNTRKGEQSSSFAEVEKENKVPLLGEQSSPFAPEKENKVPPHKENKKELKESGNPKTSFTLKQPVETADEAEEKIMAWVETEFGRNCVRGWYDNAYRKCTVRDVKNMIQTFCKVYLTIGDEGKRQRMERDPLSFFKLTFKGFLKGQYQYENNPADKRPAQNNNGNDAFWQPPSIPYSN